MRRFAVVVVAALTLAGCSWGQYGADAGNSFDNRVDMSLQAGNVGNLQERFTAPAGNSGNGFPPAPVAGGGLLLRVNASGLDAYPAAGCPGAGVPTCAALWHVAGSFNDPVTDGATVFVTDRTADRLHALNLQGIEQWHLTIPTIAGSSSTFGKVSHVESGRIWLRINDVDASAKASSRIVQLAAGGCGAASCTPNLTIRTAGWWDFFAVVGGQVFENVHTAGGDYLHALDATSGAEQWRSSAATYGSVWARDGLVVAQRASGGSDHPAVVFPTSPGTNCSGVPLTCAPIGGLALSGNGYLAITANHLAWVGNIDAGPLTWIDKALPSNCGAPPYCLGTNAGSVAGSGFPASPALAAAGGLIYFTAGNHIAAVDDNAPTNCSTGCTPKWSAALAANARALSIVGGFVYVAESDGLVHAYGLPPA